MDDYKQITSYALIIAFFLLLLMTLALGVPHERAILSPGNLDKATKNIVHIPVNGNDKQIR